MRFEDALKAMREGKKVKRTCLDDSDYYYLENKRIKDSYESIQFVLTGKEILAEDWEIIEDDN